MSTPTPSPTRFIAAQAAAGDRGALDLLLARVLPRLRRLVQRLLGCNRGCSDNINEIVQRSLIDVFLSIDRYRDVADEGFRRWLARIAVNNVYDWSRHRDRAARHQSLGWDRSAPGGGDASAACATSDQPIDAAIGHEFEQRLRVALARLPRQQGELLTLRLYEQLGDAEIAQRLGYRNADTVRTLGNRARGNLARLLQ